MVSSVNTMDWLENRMVKQDCTLDCSDCIPDSVVSNSGLSENNLVMMDCSSESLENSLDLWVNSSDWWVSSLDW